MEGLYIKINYYDSKSDPINFTVPKFESFKIRIYLEFDFYNFDFSHLKLNWRILMPYIAEIDGKEHRIEIEKNENNFYSIIIGDKKYKLDAVHSEHSLYSLILNGKSYEIDLDGKDTRRIRRHFLTHRLHRLPHDFQDMHASCPGLLKGLRHDVQRDAANLDIHLEC